MPPDSGFAANDPAEAPTPETLAQVGEGETLRRIFPRLPHADAELLGPGDDAAVVAAPDGRYVVTTDMMIQGPDFRAAWSTAHDLGWKAAMSNLADVAAMGARPTALVVGLAAPFETPVQTLLGIADGLRDACAAVAPGCGVVGGDLSTAGALTISVTAFGDLEGRRPVRRSGARPGDVVAVAGDLGRAGAGIWLLFRDGVGAPAGDGTPGEPDERAGREVRSRHPHIVEAQLAPRSPIPAGVVAAGHGATAMLDVSDGLVLDARRIAVASGCTIVFDPAAIAREARELSDLDAVVGDHAVRFVLEGGEDHALLATFPPDAPLPDGFRALGAVRSASASGPQVLVGDRAHDELGGWDPYADWDGHAG
ncbi:thiamine-phosphate kinase [Herbiconiux sp.]|uniref:thiamine-phosphate kinase n=1 Tax=Herbiconiux sp. TaxID=1871186 RepID=UPI0025BA0344|nr:thiamine-phosphate kinase [Herbiconiux sp.]